MAFSGTSGNSLVVLPVALALPEASGIPQAIVVAQTWVELVVMLNYARFVPRFIP